MDADERRKLHLEITTLKAERILKWVNFVLGISAAVILWITLVNQIADTKATNQRMLQQWQYDAACRQYTTKLSNMHDTASRFQVLLEAVLNIPELEKSSSKAAKELLHAKVREALATWLSQSNLIKLSLAQDFNDEQLVEEYENLREQSVEVFEELRSDAGPISQKTDDKLELYKATLDFQKKLAEYVRNAQMELTELNVEDFGVLHGNEQEKHRNE